MKKHEWKKIRLQELSDEQRQQLIMKVKALLDIEHDPYIEFDSSNPLDGSIFSLSSPFIFRDSESEDFDQEPLFPASVCKRCGAYILADYGDDVACLVGTNDKYECQAKKR